MVNMSLDELIIDLILQDLKHNQLIQGLDRLNLDAGYCHYLSILDLIQKLMGVPDALMDDFTVIYMSFMNRCLEFPITKCRFLFVLTTCSYDVDHFFPAILTTSF